MSASLADILESMADAGCTVAQLVAVARTFEAEPVDPVEQERERKNAASAERMRRMRERKRDAGAMLRDAGAGKEG